jgi:hypothetical protein
LSRRIGYADLRQVLAIHDDPRHSELTEWAGVPLDPRATPTAEHEKAVEALPKRWARKPLVRRKQLT